MNYDTLLKEYGYRGTQSYGRTEFATTSGLYPNKFHDGRDYTYIDKKYRNCKVLVPGVITYVGKGNRNKYGSAYGNIVEMKVSQDRVLVYCHLDSFNNLAKVGDRRLAGDDIGVIGKTGVSTGDHVHLMGRINGATADPMKIVNDYWKRVIEVQPDIMDKEFDFSNPKEYLTRVSENYEILIEYVMRDPQFLVERYNFRAGDFATNGKNFRNLPTQFWALKKTKEQFRIAIERDYNDWKSKK